MASNDVEMEDEATSSAPRVTYLGRLDIGVGIKKLIYLESAQVYVVFASDNNVYTFNGDTKVPIKIGTGISIENAHAAYASSRRSFIFHNNGVVAVRRDLNKIFALKTVFCQEEAQIEMPISEYKQWMTCFEASPDRFSDCVELKVFRDLLQSLQLNLDASSAESTLTFTVPNGKELFFELEATAKKMLADRKMMAEFPFFPLFFWLIERLRWALNGSHPYHLQNTTHTSPRMVDVSVMNSEAARVLSFHKWPHMNFQHALPSRLAETGFFFQPGQTGDDRVVCFCCRISLITWEANDEPSQEHERHHSTPCRFMDDVLSENVPLDVTCSILPPIKFGFHDVGDIRSSVNVSSEFFAIASNDTFQHAARVKFLHIDSAPLQGINCPITVTKDFKAVFSNYFDPSFQPSGVFGKVKALSVAGRERFTKSGESDDSDADCIMYLGLSVNSDVMLNYPKDQKCVLPFIFVYHVTKHLRSNNGSGDMARPRDQKKMSQKHLLNDFHSIMSELETTDLGEAVNYPENDLFGDGWSSDEMADDSFDGFKSKFPKKSRARHDEPNPFVDIDYLPYKLKTNLIGTVDLSEIKGAGWELEQIVVSDVDNGLVAAVLSSSGEKSEIVVFPRSADGQRLFSDDVKHFPVPEGQVVNIQILPVDHFASHRTMFMNDPEPFGPNIAVGSIILLLSTNDLILFDSASGNCVAIAKDAIDYTIDDKQNVVVVNVDGSIHTMHVAAPLAGIQSEKIDELAIYFLSQLDTAYMIEKMIGVPQHLRDEFPDHPSLNAVLDLMASLPVKQEFTPASVDYYHQLILTKPVRSHVAQARVMTSKTAIAALESFLQHSLGFQMVAPPHWVESVQGIQQRPYASQTLAIDGSSNSPSQRFKDSSAKEDRPLSTRVWKFNPENEPLRKAYVFEMAILPCKPLAHINFTFNFVNNSNGTPDIFFTLYRSKEERVERLFGNDDVSRLIPYCHDPSLLVSECVQLLKPLQIKNFANLQSTSATIQLSSTTILEALARSDMNDGWFTRPALLYVCIEVPHNLSLIQQANIRAANAMAATRSKSKADKSRSSRSSGLAKKKLACSRKAIILKNQKPPMSFQSLKQHLNTNRMNMAKRKEASKKPKPEEPQAPADPKHGVFFIDEFCITIFRTCDDDIPHAHLQRMLIQKDVFLQQLILHTSMKNSTSLFERLSHVDEAQIKCVDALIWLVQNWRTSTVDYPQMVLFFEIMLIDIRDAFMKMFATSPKRVSGRFCILLSLIFKIFANTEGMDKKISGYFTSFFQSVSSFIDNDDLIKFEKPGSLQNFLSVVFAVVYESTFLNKEENDPVFQAANNLLKACNEFVKKLGSTFQQKWSQSLHHTLSTKYGLNGLVFDLSIYDWPEHVMGIRTLVDPSDVDVNWKPVQHNYYAAANQGPGASYAQIASMPAMTNVQVRYPPAKPEPPQSESDQVLTSGKLFQYTEHECMGFFELLNLNLDDGKIAWKHTVVLEPEWFDMEEKPERARMNGDMSSKYSFLRLPIGSELMPGLMESEPLMFTCSGPTDYLTVYNTETGTSQKLLPIDQCVPPSTQAPEVTHLLSAAGSMPVGERSANVQLTNEIYSLFRQPAELVLCAERVTSQCRRYVILDFGGPTLLTDFIIPPCEHLFAIYVDGWYYNASGDEMRIAQSTNIGSKALIISNLLPGIMIQKIKLTFVLRAAPGKVRIPIGRFFGSKWLTNVDVQTAMCPIVASTGEPIVPVCMDTDNENMERHKEVLKFFCEEIRCRYNIAAAELRKVVEERCDILKVKVAYLECYHLRFQWNVAYNVMDKIRRATNESLSATGFAFERNYKNMWNDAETEYLKGTILVMLKFSNQLATILDLRDSVRETNVVTMQQVHNLSKEEIANIPRVTPTTIMTLETAVAMFNHYCSNSVPVLQAHACAHIFKSGCYTSWWGDFFPAVLKQHFSAVNSDFPSDGVFLLLSLLCAQSVKHSNLQQVVMEKLFSFVVEISQELMEMIEQFEGKEYDGLSNPNRSPLLSWTLQLLSTAFDVIASNKRKTDRWSFLAGMFGQAQGNAFASSSSSSHTSMGTMPSNVSGSFSNHKMPSDHISEKMFQRWRDMFNNEEFSMELEKPQFIVKRLDILLDRLQYLYSLIKEQIHGIPAVLPQKPEMETSPVHAPTPVPGPSDPAAPKLPVFVDNRLVIVPLHNSQSKIRVRQYSARLKISESLCLSVIHTLLKLVLSERSKQVIPYTSQLLAIKVISKICIHGTASAISLTCALGDNLQDLILKFMSRSTECDWLRHALLMLLVDLTDAEMRTIGKSILSRDKDLSSKIYEAYKTNQQYDEVGIEPKRHKPDLDMEVSEDNSIMTADQDQDMDDVATPESVPIPEVYGPEGCKTAIASCILDPYWAFAPPSSEYITFAHFDKPGDDVDELILKAAMATIIGHLEEDSTFLDCPGNPVLTSEVRFGVLMNWMYKLTRYYYDRGEPLTHIFHYFDEAVRGESEFVKLPVNLDDYHCFNTFAFVANGLRIVQDITTYKLQFSNSALCFLKFLNTYCTDKKKQHSQEKPFVNKEGLNFRFYQATLEAKYYVRLNGIREMCRVMHLPDGEVLKCLQGHMQRFKHKLLELTSISADVTGDRMITADPVQLKNADEKIRSFAASFKEKLFTELRENLVSPERVLGTYSKMLFINSTWPGMFSFFTTGKNHILSELSLLEVPFSTDTPPENAIVSQNSVESIQHLDTAELKCALDSLSTDDLVMHRLRTYNYNTHLQFEADLALVSESNFVMPHSFSMDSLSRMNYGYQSTFEHKCRQHIMGVLARNCVYNFVPHCATLKRSNDEPKDSNIGMGASVKSVIKVIDTYFASLNELEAPEKVIDMLLLYLEYVGSISAGIGTYSTTKSFALDKDVFTPTPLSGEAQLMLMQYMINATGNTEHLWQNALSCLTMNMRKELGVASKIITEIPFQNFIKKFLVDSLHPYGNGSNFGPTTLEYFGSFLRIIVEMENAKTRFLEGFVDILNELFGKPDSFTIGRLSVEPLLTAVEVIGLAIPRIGESTTCDASKISLLMSRLIQVLTLTFPRFTSSLLMPTSNPRTNVSSSVSLLQTNVCFSSWSSDVESITELPCSFDEVKLPSLSFTVAKTAPETVANRKVKVCKPMNTMQSIDAFEYETFEPPPGGFESYRNFGYTEQVPDRNVKDRMEILLISLVKLIDNLSFLGPIANVVIQKYPDAVKQLINLLNLCESANENVAEINTELWKPQTLADYIMFMLLSLSSEIGETGEMACRFLQIVLHTIFERSADYKEINILSTPVIFALLKVNHQMKRKEQFVDLLGHIHVAEELRRTLILLTDRWPPTSNLFSLGTQLTMLANQVNSITPQSFDCRQLPNKVVNNVRLYNFAPCAKVTGQSSPALQGVLNDPAPSRRSRSAAFSYNFSANELWFPLTITLPCQIMCHEVSIRCHQYFALNCPSAIQVEVSEGAVSRHWTLIGNQVNSSGLLTSTISLAKHRSPIGAIRVHLRRPVGHATTINLSQIMIYGVITSPKMVSEITVEKMLTHWLTVYDKFQCVQPSLWQYAPKLPQDLIQLFIRLPLEHPVYTLLKQVVCNIDLRAKRDDESIIDLIVKIIAAGGRLSDGVPPIVSAELLFSFCHPADKFGVPRCLIRQKQLLFGIVDMMERVEKNTSFHETTYAVMIWAAACVIWTNNAFQQMRDETVEQCKEVGLKILPFAWKFLFEHTDEYPVLKAALAWLLCSLSRVSPDVLDLLEANVVKHPELFQSVSLAKYRLIAKVFQSNFACSMLINARILPAVVTSLTNNAKRCVEEPHLMTEEDVYIMAIEVELLSELCNIENVCGFLQCDLGQEMFLHLIQALVLSLSIKTSKAASGYFAILDQFAIKMFKKCITFSNEHRQKISVILNKLLMSDQAKFNGRLDGTLLQLIMRLVLEDETQIVCLTGYKVPHSGTEIFKDRLLHPMFGCQSNTRIMELSIFSTVRDLIPLRSDYTIQKTKHANITNSLYEEFSGLESLMSLRKKAEPEIPEEIELQDGVVLEEYGHKHLAAKLSSSQINKQTSLDVDYTIRELIYSIGRRKSISYTYDNEVKRLFRKGYGTSEVSCGFIVLMLNLKVAGRDENGIDPEFAPQLPDNDVELTMLQHFAMCGGFVTLSKHFPMADHYSSVLDTFETLSKKQRDDLNKTTIKTGTEMVPTSGTAKMKIASKIAKWSSPSVVQLHADINNVALATHALQQQVQSVLTHVGNPSSSLHAMIAGTPVSLSVIEPSAIMAYPNGEPSSSSYVPKTLASQSMSTGQGMNYSEQMSQALYSMIGGGNAQIMFAPVQISNQVAKMVAAPAPGLSTFGDKEVPAYTIFALSVFLKLDYYAIALVTSDRFQAKRVLRAAMGLGNTERDIDEIMANFQPILPANVSVPVTQSPVNERKHGLSVPCPHVQEKPAEDPAKVEADNLTIYPFEVLEKIWTLSGPLKCPKELAEGLRKKKETLSVLDVILLCASRFSNTAARAVTTFSPSSDAQVIDQIFQLSDQIDSLKEAMAAANPQKAPNPNATNYTPMLQQMMIMDGNGGGPTNNQNLNGGNGFWAKGTGFGSGTTSVQWNLSEHVRKRKLNEEAVTCMMNTISGFLMPAREYDMALTITEENIGLLLSQVAFEKTANFHKDLLTPEEQFTFDFDIASRVYNSCLMPVVHSYLTNDSVFDISKHLGIYEACIWFVITIASLNPILVTPEEKKMFAGIPENEDIFAAMLMEPCAGETISSHVKKMHSMIKAYLTTVEKERHMKPAPAAAPPTVQIALPGPSSMQVPMNVGFATEEMAKAQEQDACADDAQEEENLEMLEALLQKAIEVLNNRLGSHGSVEDMEVDEDAKKIREQLTFEQLYSFEMKPLQYESIPYMKDDNKLVIPHHFSSQFMNNKQVGNPKRMRRLAQEAITLSSSLPLSISSTVFLRAAEERLDLFKVLITGPADTPYANGCFEFDAYFPPDYPSVPVQINLQTTGNNAVRFNPNLYNDGKVCLSVLNTWHGRPEERWNAETSSFLQVLVSIQSLILVNEPYFNEPGYERSRNTTQGQQASEDYDANIRAMTVRWAILEQLRNPSKAFEDVIKIHFYLKKEEILAQVKKWIDEMQKTVDESSETTERTNVKNSLVSIKRSFEQLKEELSKIQPPKGLEEVNVPSFDTVQKSTNAMEVEPTPGPSGISNRPASR